MAGKVIFRVAMPLDGFSEYGREHDGQAMFRRESSYLHRMSRAVCSSLASGRRSRQLKEDGLA
jgi:hypothetical protein